jgi:protein-S-isoprenylcysteine O-methyltransferase Ste14
MIVIAMTVAIVSYISGATFVDIAIRTGVTLIIVGFLLYVIAKKIVNASIEVTSQMVEEATTVSTVDKQG